MTLIDSFDGRIRIINDHPPLFPPVQKPACLASMITVSPLRADFEPQARRYNFSG
jgi:hypothetical protein